MYANASIVQDTKKTGKRIAKVVGHDDGQYRRCRLGAIGTTKQHLPLVRQ